MLSLERHNCWRNGTNIALLPMFLTFESTSRAFQGQRATKQMMQTLAVTVAPVLGRLVGEVAAVRGRRLAVRGVVGPMEQ